MTSKERKDTTMNPTPRQVGELWSIFERRHTPQIITRRVGVRREEDVSGFFPQQFSDVLEFDHVWHDREEYADLEGQALKEYNSLSRLHGASTHRTAEYLVAVGYDADLVEAVFLATQARGEQIRRRALEREED